MTRWNPSAPSLVGPEFFGRVSQQESVQGAVNHLQQRFRSNSAESIAAARIHRATTGVGYPGAYLVEVLNSPTLPTSQIAQNNYAPNALAIIAGTVTDSLGGPPSAGLIDEWPPTYVSGDVVGMGPGAAMDLQFAAASFTSGAGRIANVGVELVTAWGTGVTGGSTSTDQVRRTVVSLVDGGSGGTLYGTQTKIIPNNNGSGTAGRAMFSWGELNPVTGRPWTAAEIQSLDTATLQVRVARVPGDKGAWNITAARLVVVYEQVERRAAVGVLTTTGTTALGWSLDVPLFAPDGTPGWSKVIDTDYTLSVRSADRGALTGIVYDYLNLTSLQAAPGTLSPVDLPAFGVTAENVFPWIDGPSSLGTAVPTSAGRVEQPGKLYPFVLRTLAGGTSADGQPYSSVAAIQVYDGAGDNWQELTIPVGDDFATLRLMLGRRATAPTQDLTVQVRRHSDHVLMGTFTITPEDLALAGANTADDLVLVEAQATAPGITLSTVQYDLQISSLTPVATPWLVGLLAVNSNGVGTLYQEATFNGGTDEAEPIGGNPAFALNITPADFITVLGAAVDGPANFAASAELEPIDDPPGSCPPDGIPYARLTWDVTALGGNFAYYQLQRLDPVLGWTDIAIMPDETTDEFDDFEGRLSTAEIYRLRVVRTDGAASYWSAEKTVTTDDAGCILTFTSNQAPAMSVAYADVYESGAERTYQFPEADEVQVRRMFDRDYQVAFRPLSRRGVAFTRTLLIAAISAPVAGVGPPAAAELRDLAWATVDYVCVRDSDGNRWFGSITVPDLAVRQPAQLHRATLTFIETTAVPAVAQGEPGDGPTGDFTFIGGDTFLLVGGAGPLDLV